MIGKRLKRAADTGNNRKVGENWHSLASAPSAQEIYDGNYLFARFRVSFLTLFPAATLDALSLMLVTVYPSHTPMTVPRGNHLKRPRGSFTRHKLSQQPRERVEERNVPIIAPTDPRSTRALTSTSQSQSCPASHRRRKRRRFSASYTGVLQHHLPITSQTKPAHPATPSTLPSTSSRADEEVRSSVISERLRLKMSNSSSTATHGRHHTGQVCTYEDWQDIKELFAKAAEQYNGEHAPNFFFSPPPICPSPITCSIQKTDALCE